MTVKILHITDIHDGHPKNDGLFVRTLDELETYARLSGDDRTILVVTGDIIDYPQGKRLRRAADLLRKFHERTEGAEGSLRAGVRVDCATRGFRHPGDPAPTHDHRR